MRISGAAKWQSFRRWRAPSTFWHMVTFLIFVESACAQDETGFAQETRSARSLVTPRNLFGDWNGERTRLAEKGVTFESYYITDLEGNPEGGKEQTRAGWGRFRGTIDVDLTRLIGVNGLTFHATGVWQFGANLGEKIGTIANPSGLVSAHTTRLDSWWLQQAILNDKILVKVGQFAGLDSYGDQEYGAAYIIEPLDYAIGNLFSTTYESFNPAATPAAEIRFAPTENFYIKSAMLAGNRAPYVQDPTGFHFTIADTPVFVYELGWLVKPANRSASEKTYPGTYKVGASYNGGKFQNPVTGTYSRGNYLIYVMANQAVYRSTPGSDRGVDLDFGFDWSPSDTNRQNSQLTAGLRYNGVIPRRDHDGFALGVVYSRISDRFSLVGTRPGFRPFGSEKAIELNYVIQVSPCWLFQPVLQYYVDVGGSAQIPNAAVFGLRTKVIF